MSGDFEVYVRLISTHNKSLDTQVAHMTVASKHAGMTLEIETERTRLVPLSMSRVPLICRYYQENLEHLLQWDAESEFEEPSKETWEAYAKWSEQESQANRQIEFLVLDQAQKEMLAFCSFSYITQAPTWTCDLGFSIAKAHEGIGLMSEALAVAIESMFSTRGMHRVVARYHADNTRSAALLERLGFEHEGCARAYQKVKGIWSDHQVVALVNPAHC